jgi:hypothetical protein
MPDNLNDRKNVSKHILPTSSNLLGLCFVLISFMKLWKMKSAINLVIDKFVAVSIVFFLIASVFSYMSMRSKEKMFFYENVADILFLIGLFSITIISLIITFEIL